MKKSKKLNRRDFLKLSTLATASLPIALSGFPLFASEKPKDFQFLEDNENILVLIQLQGGNDGLNTVFNNNQYDNLQSVRSNIIVPEANLLSLDNGVALHPSLAGLKEIWDHEKLSIIQNVGYPNQNGSHFRSTDIWNSASSSNENITSGWLGRFFGEENSEYPVNYPNKDHPHPFAITIGKVVSETCQGKSANFSMAVSDPNNPGTALLSSTGEISSNCYGDSLNYINNTISQTNAYADIVKNASESGNNLSTKYENTNNTKLAGKLKNVAKLISGGLKSKVYIVQLGGFDTHNNQVEGGNVTEGIHSRLLKELSDAIAAFQEDLELLNIDQKVVGMTYSEFGRKIRSNNSLGTDHGAAAPLFLFGTCAKNQVLGDAPEIDTKVDEKESVQMQYDFRNIYSTILTDWLGATKQESTSVLFNEFDALPIFKKGCSASLSSDDFLLKELEISVYPNPTIDSVNIKFLGNNEIVKITLYNSIGAVVKQITSEKYSSIQHTLKVDVHNLPKGNYFIHYQSKGISKTKKLLKY
ncbi:DUF1501 domain-containing protein [Polaribacter sp. Z014]|uniref:DUF1501 domain-containing protein n=1 Tax=Polaribacter sp. Z014 TaxID=2927126 RepID=UPI0020226FD8|nr:DUF1501 domain-containing protein [Polaribacter sp. Z014]MCL7764825.1 DUF1501 domain-containing protein [Polaribacter sp. Z014]